MTNKNLNTTKDTETLIPIIYIEDYRKPYIKDIFNIYKFNNKRKDVNLLNLCIDLFIYNILKYNQTIIIFTYPPSTMFYRKEKDIDSVANLINQTNKYLNFYFKKGKDNKYYIKNLFSIKKKYLKNKKAQHIEGSKNIRLKNLNHRYYLNIYNKFLLKKISRKNKVTVILIDDVSTTGATLFACKKVLNDFDEKITVKLFSLAH